MVSFEQSESFYKNQLRSFVPPKNTGSYKEVLKILVFILLRISEFSLEVLIP